MANLADERLQNLVTTAWEAWDAARNDERLRAVVPKASAPILWFGRIAQFLSSQLRVVTVGVNPGKGAFPADDPADDPWRLYPELRTEQARELVTYRHAMDAFLTRAAGSRTSSDLDWFTKWDPFLSSFEASFERADTNAPIHTDLLSPMMTRPQWSEVDRTCQRALIRRGVPIWLQVVEYLEPDFVVASLATDQGSVLRGAIAAFEPLSPPEHVEINGHSAWRERRRVGNRSCLFAWIAKKGREPLSKLSYDLRAAAANWVLTGEVYFDDAQARLLPEQLVELLEQALEDTADDQYWRTLRGRRVWRNTVRLLSPDGEPVHLSQQASVHAIRRFVTFWRSYPPAHTNWQRHRSREYDHVSLPGIGHIPGLYLRYD